MGRENRTDGLPLNPELIDLLRELVREEALSLRTHTIATVLSYNATTQRAKVSVDQLQVVKNLAKNPTKANPNPTLTLDPEVLDDVPVAWPRTSSGYLTFSLNTGDKGELHVQDRNITAYLVAGRAKEPATRWTHDLADAVFHPTIFHNADPITPPTDQTATVVEGVLVRLGRAAALGAARTTDAVTATALMTTWITTVSSALTTLGIPVTPPVDFGFISGGSTKVQVE
jgi:hypothetical protein